MNIKTQVAWVNSVEKSQAFILDIYNSVLNALQSVNERTDKLEKKGAEIMKTTDRLTTQTNGMGQSMYRVDSRPPISISIYLNNSFACK